MRGLIQNYKYVPLFLLILSLLVPFNETSADEQKNNFNFSHFQSPDYEYIIGPGDSLEILVWKEPELSRSFSVRIDGRISIPLLGDIKVSGETIDGLTKILEKRFQEIVAEPIVSVILQQSKSWRYYVIGKVGGSGEYTIDYPISVLQAISKSGGFSEWAKTDQIKIIRGGSGGKQTIVFDYEALTKKNDLGQDILLGPGDIVLVP